MGIGDLLAQISGDTPSSTVQVPSIAPSLKRGADGDLKHSGDKIRRTNPISSSASRPVPQVNRPLTSTTTTPTSARTKPVETKSKSVSNRPLTSNHQSLSKPQGRPPQNVSSAVVQQASPSVKPPKKGSFAEIMARAKVAQASLGQVGKIQHKAIKSTVKRDRQDDIEEDRIARGKGSSKGAKSRAESEGVPLKDGRNGARENKGKPPEKRLLEAEKKSKKPVQSTGYMGTARPNPIAKPATKSGTSKYDKGPSYSSRYRHASDEDEDDEDEDIDEDDYDSEGSSDMEAAAFEVDEEEERAAAIARKEDAEALREENRLKREKEEKKRRLAAMAQARR